MKITIGGDFGMLNPKKRSFPLGGSASERSRYMYVADGLSLHRALRSYPHAAVTITTFRNLLVKRPTVKGEAVRHRRSGGVRCGVPLVYKSDTSTSGVRGKAV